MASSTSSSPHLHAVDDPTKYDAIATAVQQRHHHWAPVIHSVWGSARATQFLGRGTHTNQNEERYRSPCWRVFFCPFKTHFGSGSPNEAMVGDSLTNTDWRRQPKSGQATSDQKSKRQKGKSEAPKQESEARQQVARKSGRRSNPVPPRSGNQVEPIGPR
jgi:hypothetical protein